MMANFDFAIEYGNSFDIKNFISLANANPAAQSISRDLLAQKEFKLRRPAAWRQRQAHADRPEKDD